jgi:septal ring factor EnvC (AmiA/AmiB activator)
LERRVTMENEIRELMLEQFTKIFKRFDVFEDSLSRTESKVNALENGLARTESKVDALENGLARTESKIDKLEIRMENEVIEKIRALFDDRDVQNAMLNSLKEKQDSILADINYLVNRVVRLEKLAQ